MNIIAVFFIFSFFISFNFLHANNTDKVIVMGYKSIAKPPLIGEEDDNSGLYLDLFNKAAKKIGYRLEIKRLPKKRLHLELEKGNIDFYPGSSFSSNRAEYLYFLDNGLQTKEVLVSLNKNEEIRDMNDAKGVLIVELGSSKLEWDDIYPNISIIKLSKLSMDMIIHAIKFNRGDFYIADIEIVDFYKKFNNLSNYEEIGIKIHYDAINKDFVPMYMGFSRKSKYFAEKKNLQFDENKIISIKNFPTIIDSNSVAYQFYLALQKLKEEGVTQELYDKYFK